MFRFAHLISWLPARRRSPLQQAENNFGRGRSKNGVVEPSFTADPECPIHGFDAILKMLEENNEDGSEC